MPSQSPVAGYRVVLALALAIGLACGASGCDAKPQRARPAAAKTPAPPPAAEPAPAEPAPSAEPAAAAAADDLIAVDGPGLIDRIRKSGGKGTLVNVWASWCGSCKRELPMLIDLAKALEPDGIQLLLVSADEPEKRAEAAAMLAKLSPRPQALIVQGPLGPFKRAINPEWQGAIPSTFLFNAEGELRYSWLGPTLEHEIATITGAFLAGQPLEEAAQ